MPNSLWSVVRCALRTTVLLVAASSAELGFLSAACDAATASIVLNQTEFRAGDTLSVGVQVGNPSDGPAANLYLGVVMPDGNTALFLVQGGTTPPVSLLDPANFRSLQAAPPGFSLNAPQFTQFTFPADGLPIGTYLVFAALTRASDGGVLALDIKPFTYSPRNVFLPMFRKPFDGDTDLRNWFDHDLPFEFTDTNGFLRTYAGEQSGGIDGHNGYDFAMPEGTPLRSAADGTVTFAGDQAPFACPILNNQIVVGRIITIRHTAPNGESIDSSYHHVSRIDVTVGQHVVAGHQIGLSGNVGCSTGPHLHFEAYRVTNTNTGGRARIDPFGWDSTQGDPWAQYPQGAQSLYLWLPGQAPTPLRGGTLAPNCGTPPTCGNAAVTITRWSQMGVRDDLNPNNEFVELTLDTRFNNSATSRSLTGFTLQNRRGDVFPLPAGLVIRDGQPIRIHSGRGVNGAAVLFLGLDRPIWDNLQECIQLVTPGGGRYRINLGGCS